MFKDKKVFVKIIKKKIPAVKCENSGYLFIQVHPGAGSLKGQ